MRKLPKKDDPLAQIARSLDILVKLKIEEVRKDRNQQSMIELLFDLGVGGGEIANLLGISRKTVDPALSKLRAARKNGPKNAKKNEKPKGKEKRK